MDEIGKRLLGFSHAIVQKNLFPKQYSGKNEEKSFINAYTEARKFITGTGEEDAQILFTLLWEYLDFVGYALKGEDYAMIKDLLKRKIDEAPEPEPKEKSWWWGRRGRSKT